MQADIKDTWLRGLRPPKAGRLEVWDTKTPGLVLRLMPTGAATWSVRLRTKDGKKTRPKLGAWPALGIAKARKLALAAIADIQRGADPVAEKRAAKAARKARAEAPTVAQRLEEWRAHRAPEWSDRYGSEVARLIKREIPPRLAKRPLSETTRSDWTDLIRAKHAKAPGVGSMLYRTIAAFLNHSEVNGWIPAALLPRKGLAVIAPPVAARERTLTDDELGAVWRATDGLPAKQRAFVRLLIVTACREMEAADVALAEVDLDVGRWTIPGRRTKNGRTITLPLPPSVVADLKGAWPEHGDDAGGDWRLLGAVAGSGFRGFSKLKRTLDEKAAVTGWRFHDLRRTARTVMTRLGVPPHHAEAALNHVSGRSALERTYDRHDFAPEIISALERWQAHVAALVTKMPAAKVLPLRRPA